MAVDQAFDWICVGSGTSGLAAAIFGHDRGLKTLVLEKASKIGGTTAQGGEHDDGTVFELDPATDTLTTPISFDDTTGQFPRAGLVADAAGNIYGTTTQDGPDGGGTVFELSGTGFVPIAPVPEPGALSLLCMSSIGLIYRSRRSRRVR